MAQEGRDSLGRFVTGHQGFKPKGSRTAITKRHLDTIAKKIADDGDDVADKLYQLLEHPETSPDLQFKILSKLMDYSNDPRFIETDESGNDVVDYSREDLIRQLSQEII